MENVFIEIYHIHMCHYLGEKELVFSNPRYQSNQTTWRKDAMSEFTNQISIQINTKCPLIIVQTQDKRYVKNELMKVAEQLKSDICFWDKTHRLHDLRCYSRDLKGTIKIEKFISNTDPSFKTNEGSDSTTSKIRPNSPTKWFESLKEQRDGESPIYNHKVKQLCNQSSVEDILTWFRKASYKHPFIMVIEGEYAVISYLSVLFDDIGNTPSEKTTLIFVMSENYDGDEEKISTLGEYSFHISVSYPDSEALLEMYLETLRMHHIPLPPKRIQQSILDSLSGLTLTDAERLLQTIILENRKLGEGELPLIHKARYSALSTETLNFVDTCGDGDIIGGYDNLKKWLIEHSDLTSQEARDFGIHPPRGILLVGPPGTGKSLAAKAVARTLNRPLLSWDLSTLFKRYVGEGEKATRETLRHIDSLGPVVISIDEMEKLVGNTHKSGNAHESTIRLLGMLMTWLSERTSPAFIVASANSLASLPPEATRQGRWDECFYISLPALREREEILAIHLKKRGHEGEISATEIHELAKLSAGFSGSELEQVIQSALIPAFRRDKHLTAADIHAAISKTSPLSKRRPEDIQAYCEMVNMTGIPASLEKPDYSPIVDNKEDGGTTWHDPMYA